MGNMDRVRFADSMTFKLCWSMVAGMVVLVGVGIWAVVGVGETTETGGTLVGPAGGTGTRKASWVEISFRCFLSSSCYLQVEQVWWYVLPVGWLLQFSLDFAVH